MPIFGKVNNGYCGRETAENQKITQIKNQLKITLKIQVK